MRGSKTSGGVQFTSILLILAIAIVGYFFWALVPAFSDNMDARQAISGIINQAWRRMGKEEIHKQVLEKLSTIGSHVETPAGGVTTVVKGLPIDDDSVVVLCSDEPGDCSTADGEVTVTVTYTRVVPLPYLTGKSLTLHFAPTAKESLKPAQW